jgi:starch phosphorylase
MLHDPERLRALLTDPDRPGAARSSPASRTRGRRGQAPHPEARRVLAGAGRRERIVFLPNYDIGMAQLLYPGTDIWLNNPLRRSRRAARRA